MPTQRSVRVVAAVVRRGERYLITQRRNEAVLGGLWEFPGGRVEEGESDHLALAREFRERLGADAEVGELITERHNAYEEYSVTLALYSATLAPEAELQPLRVQDFRWVPSEELDSYPFPAADKKTMDVLLGTRC